jgi:hypothetical protein
VCLGDVRDFVGSDEDRGNFDEGWADGTLGHSSVAKGNYRYFLRHPEAEGEEAC